MKTLLAVALVLAASPAFADAVTYQGTIGDKAIVVEFSETPDPANDKLFARYFYVDQGVDIPLHAAAGERSRLGLVEEVACKEELNNCPHSRDETPSDPPLGAKWQLKLSADAGELTGEFALKGRNLPVTLTKVGTRSFDPAEGLPGFATFATGLFYEGTVLTPETSPYDYLKMTLIKLETAATTELEGSHITTVTDPRTKFAFPRIVDLVGGADPAVPNRVLEQRHWAMNLDALYCVSQQYQGFGWNGGNFDAGTLGWYDEEAVSLQYMSPTILTWTEGGSLSCGYAHPYNHYEFHNLDVASGKPLDLSRLFKGWVATDFDGKLVDLDMARADPGQYHWGPDEALAAFVNAHRPTDAELDAPEECGMDGLVQTNLAISFKPGERVLFALGELEYAIQDCGTDLYEAPVAELKDLLTPEAANYFPSLAN